MIFKLGMQLPGPQLYKVCINGDPRLTYFTARSNLVKIVHCASDQKSGVRLQDHWSSGFSCRTTFFYFASLVIFVVSLYEVTDDCYKMNQVI